MKNMKWLSLLLAMALLVSAMSLTAFAAGVPTITVVGNEGAPVVSGGGGVTVPSSPQANRESAKNVQIRKQESKRRNSFFISILT